MSNKGIRSLIIVALGCVTSLFAIDDLDWAYTNNEEKIYNLEKRIDQATEERYSQELGGKNPSSRGCPPNKGLYTTIEFLLWKVQNTGAVVCWDMQKGEEFGNIYAQFGDLKHVKIDWDPGMRLGIGINTPYDHWDVLALWTWHRNVSEENISATTYQSCPTPSGLLSTLPFTFNWLWPEVQAGFKTNYNTIDLEVGRAYYLTKAFSLRPFIGSRVGWLFQKINNIFFGDNPLSVWRIRKMQVESKNNFWGIGPRIGVDPRFSFAKNFSVMGKISTALLFGRTNISEELSLVGVYYYTVSPLSFLPMPRQGELMREHANISYDYSKLAPTLQILLGFEWSTCLRNDTMFFSFGVAWETNYYWNQYNIPTHFVNYSFMPVSMKEGRILKAANKPIGIKGFTIQSRIDF